MIALSLKDIELGLKSPMENFPSKTQCLILQVVQVNILLAL